MAGPKLTIRPLRHDDHATLDAWFAGLSDRSRELRFCTPIPRLTLNHRSQLLAVDGVGRLGLVAEVRRFWSVEVVGMGHLFEVAAGQAEVAIAVSDAWHGRGVGRRLVADLGRVARALGYHELVAYTLPRNGVFRRLLRSVFPETRHFDDGDVLVSLCPLGATLPLEREGTALAA